MRVIKSLCVVLENGNTFAAIVEKELPTILNDQVLLKILYGGICGTDIKLINGKYPIDGKLFPLTLGHEFVGEIIEVGTNVKDYKIGDIVVGKATLKSCGKCIYCKTGTINLCSDRLRVGINTDGAFSEYLAFPEEQLINVNFLNDIKNGVWLEPISVVARGINTLKVNPTFNVAITGVGPIGILTALILKEFGVHITLIGLESDLDRLNFMKDSKYVHEIKTDVKSNNLFDVVVDCSGSENAINKLFEWAKPGSQVLLLGTNKFSMNINLSQITYKELKVTGTLGANEEDWIYGIEFLRKNEIILSQLLNILPLDEVIQNLYVRNTNKAKNAIQF